MVKVYNWLNGVTGQPAQYHVAKDQCQDHEAVLQDVIILMVQIKLKLATNQNALVSQNFDFI